uniref:glucuronosyltransferase n=1 Tax=Strongyloides venezuelensis TaxID=75913 RepID=A0A0K0FE02_STRVS
MVGIANLLSNAGHDVTIIQSPMNPELDDSNVRGPKIEKPLKRNSKMDGTLESLKNVRNKSFTLSGVNPFDILNTFYDVSVALTESCENTMMDEKITKRMKDEKFDLGISESFAPCGLGVLKHYNITNTVSVFSGCSFDSHYEILGLSVPVAQSPTSVAPLPSKMNIFERILNLLSYIVLKKSYSDSINIGNSMFKRFYKEGEIDLHNLFKESAFYIDNCDPLLSFGSPSTPKFLHLGGFLSRESKPLSSEYDEVLSRRKRNVLISFGSITESSKMTDNMKKNLARLFKEYPDVTFLWKYDKDRPEILKGIGNVFLSKWMPQLDLLADPRMSLFITHGGMNSFLEASKYGVPLIDIPLFGDQPKNAKIVEELKLGRIVDKFVLQDNYEEFNIIFDDVFNNVIYRETAKKMSHMISQRPYDPKEIFIKTIEFAAKFGRVDHYTIPGADIPYWKFFYLDAILIFIGILLVKFIIIKTVLRKVKDFIFGKKKSQKID